MRKKCFLLLQLILIILFSSVHVSGAETKPANDTDAIESAKEALFGDFSGISDGSLSSGASGDGRENAEEQGTAANEQGASSAEQGSANDEVTAVLPAEENEPDPSEMEVPGADIEAGEAADEASEGILSVPDHPLSVMADKMVFIGDSRTVDMMNAVGDDSIWCCKVSMGYNWMVTEGVPAVDGYIDSNTAVIILLGVNDPHNISNYIGYTNEKAAEWAARGATTYFVSVGPVTADPYVTNAEIEAFNAALQANLSGVYYIDIYSYLMANGFSTIDGTHYPADVSIAIYNYIIDHLEENRVGIWG
ncbi:MAG: hypothetical protein IJ123_00030 [Blautia sp.]|nr:hypothetical protein [Blautia sp.]